MESDLEDDVFEPQKLLCIDELEKIRWNLDRLEVLIGITSSVSIQIISPLSQELEPDTPVVCLRRECESDPFMGKEVTFTLDQFTTIYRNLRELDMWFIRDPSCMQEEDRVMDLGDGLKVSTSRKFPLVDIRKFFKCRKFVGERPTRMGVALSPCNYPKLRRCIRYIYENYFDMC